MTSSSDLDDDLALGADLFDVRQCVFGRFEGKDLIDDRAYGAGIDEGRELAELVSTRFHEQERIGHLASFRCPSDSEAQQAHRLLHDPVQSGFFRESGIGWAGDGDDLPSGFENAE